MVTDKDTKFGDWLKKALGRTTFRTTLNDHIDAAVTYKLYDRGVRHNLANDNSPDGLEHFKKVVKHSVFGKEFQIDNKKLKSIYN